MRIIIALLIVYPLNLFSQNNTNYILELDYSRRKVDNSYYYIKIRDSSDYGWSGNITDSLIVNKLKYNTQSLLFSFKIIDNMYIGSFIERDKSIDEILFGIHQKTNITQLFFKKKDVRLHFYLNTGIGFSFYSKRFLNYNNRNSFVLENFFTGVETFLQISKHLGISTELKYFSDTFIGSRHPLFVQFGISYNWGKPKNE